MAVEATLERDGDVVTLPLVEEGAGAPLVARDIGKPESGPSSKGIIDPRWSDQWSQLETYTLSSRFTSSDAYVGAIELADLIKSHSGGEDLLLNIDLPEFDADMVVAPAPEQEQAVSIAYDVGQTEFVDVEVSLTRVNQTSGSGSQGAETPTASGDGPITLSRASTSIELTSDVVVDRTVGRPNSVVRRSTQTYPNYIDHQKAAFDEFELGFEFGDDAVSNVSDLVSMIGTPLGRSALTLDFNGIYGLGAFDVVPRGSSALRTVRPSGEEGTVIVPSLNLRRVTA